ncbi:MAG TPA: SEC-C metal-binding domain-containing protein, partial [Vicinamibacteria bacterium]|nr:SEC-C metal-binding domain-containing protein [Vicinamibacteria bacterium]
MPDLGRNDPCHCGSGRKYKQCCLAKDEAKEREARAKTAAEAPATSEPEAAKPQRRTPRHTTEQPWKKAQNT